MLAGLILPERPIGNMYFAAWSHNVINNAVGLSNDLKMGEYRTYYCHCAAACAAMQDETDLSTVKIPPRVMFLTQVYGTLLGGFISYAVMTSIVNSNRELLTDSDGNSSWSGATLQSYNTSATSWALANYLYKTGARYAMVPIGLAVGAGVVVVHRVVVHVSTSSSSLLLPPPPSVVNSTSRHANPCTPQPQFVPRIRKFSLYDINMPQFIQYAGYIPYNASQTCVLLSQVIAGFFVQFYLRNYRPRIFRDYSYLVTGAFDGASLSALFILSFAVFGAGGPSIPFPSWWGNNVDGYYDLCPVPE